MARLTDLPPELVLIVVEYLQQPTASTTENARSPLSEILSFGRSSRYLHSVASPSAYKLDALRKYPEALIWGAITDNVPVVEKAIAAGTSINALGLGHYLRDGQSVTISPLGRPDPNARCGTRTCAHLFNLMIRHYYHKLSGAEIGELLSYAVTDGLNGRHTIQKLIELGGYFTVTKSVLGTARLDQSNWQSHLKRSSNPLARALGYRMLEHAWVILPYPCCVVLEREAAKAIIVWLIKDSSPKDTEGSPGADPCSHYRRLIIQYVFRRSGLKITDGLNGNQTALQVAAHSYCNCPKLLTLLAYGDDGDLNANAPRTPLHHAVSTWLDSLLVKDDRVFCYDDGNHLFRVFDVPASPESPSRSKTKEYYLNNISRNDIFGMLRKRISELIEAAVQPGGRKVRVWELTRLRYIVDFAEATLGLLHKHGLATGEEYSEAFQRMVVAGGRLLRRWGPRQGLVALHKQLREDGEGLLGLVSLPRNGHVDDDKERGTSHATD
ncbi:hypothetical protein OQA88_4360 [Cercophora sp. LCS_1]